MVGIFLFRLLHFLCLLQLCGLCEPFWDPIMYQLLSLQVIAGCQSSFSTLPQGRTSLFTNRSSHQGLFRCFSFLCPQSWSFYKHCFPSHAPPSFCTSCAVPTWLFLMSPLLSLTTRLQWESLASACDSPLEVSSESLHSFFLLQRPLTCCP